MPAGKFVALVTPGKAFSSCAFPDLALPAVHKPVIGQAAPASNVFRRKVFTVGKTTFPADFSSIKARQPLFELEIAVTVCHINGADAAIKPTRRNKIRIYVHDAPRVVVWTRLQRNREQYVNIQAMVIGRQEDDRLRSIKITFQSRNVPDRPRQNPSVFTCFPRVVVLQPISGDYRPGGRESQTRSLRRFGLASI